MVSWKLIRLFVASAAMSRGSGILPQTRSKGGENMASSIHCLFRLARKYLSVQATSAPAKRVMSSMGIVLEKRRQSMTGELFAEIMFLSDTV